MAQVLDVLLVLLLTPGAVAVLKGRQWASGESPMVADGAVAVPGSDTARQDALNGASVKVCEGLRGQASFLRLKRRCCSYYTTLCGWTISDCQ